MMSSVVADMMDELVTTLQGLGRLGSQVAEGATVTNIARL
jgi:hypothetical protein